MTLSATAIQPALTYAPPATVITDPAAADAWIAALPEAARKRLQEKLLAIYRKLPPVTQLEIQRNIVEQGGALVIPSALDGLGLGTLGLMDWGLVAVSLANVGAQVFNAQASNRLQRDIISGGEATSAEIARIQADAAKEAQLAMIEAQREAVSAKAVVSAQTRSMMATSMPYILGGVGVLGLLYVILKTRSRKTP